MKIAAIVAALAAVLAILLALLELVLRVFSPGLLFNVTFVTFPLRAILQGVAILALAGAMVFCKGAAESSPQQ